MKFYKKVLSLILVAGVLVGMSAFRIETVSYAEQIARINEAKSKALISDLKKDSLMFKHIDEKSFGKKQPIQRLSHKEDLNTYHFLNSDGTESVYIMDKNVKYVTNNGTIREKNISLSAATDFYKVNESDVVLSIPKKMKDGVRFEYGESNIKLTPKVENQNVTALFNKADNTVTYEDYFGTGVDLKYTPTLSGVKEDIILSAYNGMSSFEFVLMTNGLKVFFNQSGYYIAETDDAEDKISLGNTIVYDAIGKPDIGTLEVETVKEGSEYILTVSANVDFLTDETTRYPVVIDPTLEVSDNIQGFNSIVDATVFEGYPTQNFGGYQYCTLGQIDSTYGRARTFVRFDGLTTNPIYNTINDDDIVSAKLYVKEASGMSSLNVSVHYNQDTTAWTETNITWNTASQNLSGAIATANLNNNEWTSFELTDYVKRCKTAELDMSSGLIMRLTGSETDTFRQFDASENGTAGFRPYIELLLLGGVQLSLSEHVITLDEGEDWTLTATTNPANMDIEWSSDNLNVARVLSSGRIMARNAGVAKITAKIKGTSLKRTCTVYVTVADGIYVIQNKESGDVLDVENDGIANNTNVLMCDQHNNAYGLNQRWRVKHLSVGYYSIRPVHKLDMCLYSDGSDATTYFCDTLNENVYNIPITKRWTITYEVIDGTNERGYVFKTEGSKALTYDDEYTTAHEDAIVAQRDLSDRKQSWTLSTDFTMPESGLRVYDGERGTFYDSNYHTDQINKHIVIGTSRDFDRTEGDSYKIIPAYYTGNIDNGISQYFSTSSSNPAIISLDRVILENGEEYKKVVAHEFGTVEINFESYATGHLSCKIIFDAVFNGYYFIKNKTGRTYIEAIDNETEMQYGTGGTEQKWTVEYAGDGYYTIFSHGENLYLSVDSSRRLELNAPLVLSYMNGTNDDDRLWKIERTENGNFTFKAKSVGNENLVASLRNDNTGSSVVNGQYVDNDSYMDEWKFFNKITYEAYVNNYYDSGYVARNYGIDLAKESINDCMEGVSSVYYDLFDLEITYGEPMYFNSLIDQCNCTNDKFSSCCSHANEDVLYDDFEDRVECADYVTNIFWTGYDVTDGEYVSRSFFYNDIIFMLEGQEVQLHQEYVLFHELAHQFEANDHYHEENVLGICEHYLICSECDAFGNGRSKNCAMYDSSYYIAESQRYLCADCRQEIIDCLESKHY